ncbi:glutamate--cysteine ligase [Iamia sp. SCSIO 61187]|uniref:carboxylate-amine ligase n=1 Tax=Iamia sp. SCSIO 61187 TaxID=2722752 RepID=UPI001C632766|nr:glutamate--cysteine ligase [Iamia sp. SCSIO 61187]QYG92284.1 glutamate--cysteine ligase [Iamia sp. SCSIO 61187]
MAAHPSPASCTAPTVGVEEELFVVDDATGELSAVADEVIAVAVHGHDDQIEPELSQAQVETGSAVCATLVDLSASLTSLRRRLDRAARSRSARVLATGTHPSSSWERAGGVTEKAAYLKLADDYGHLTDEQVVSGCHVHVGVPDPGLAIQVMNRVRLDVPVLLALSANSPFWGGIDTRYASYRTEVFHRWPTTGLPEPFASRSDYDELVATMRSIDAIDAPARLYWDLRPSARYPTLELRVADVPMTVEESVTVAGLFRALVVEATAQVEAGQPTPSVRPEILRAALWRSARYGLEGDLLDVRAPASRPARDVLDALVDRLSPHLDALGDVDDVCAGVARVVAEGTGAERQRRAFARRGRLTDVTDAIAAATVP